MLPLNKSGIKIQGTYLYNEMIIAVKPMNITIYQHV